MTAPTSVPIPRSAATVVTGLGLALVAAPAVAFLFYWTAQPFFLATSVIISIAGLSTFLVGLHHALQRFDRHTDLSGAGEAPVTRARPKPHLSSPVPVATSVPGGRWGIGAPTE